jgi:bifunctional non-homologous end joining protein LigD
MLLRPGLPPADARDQWVLELKWDGMRAQFRVASDGSWCLRSRPGRNCSVQFPELEPVAAALHGQDLLLDGELVCLDADGRPDFHRLRRRLSASNADAASALAARHPAMLIAFDVLHLDGRAVRTLPYHRRRELLERTLPDSGRCWRIPAALTGTLDAVLEVTRAHQLEGIVAKRLDAPYEPGQRSGAWLKHKHRRKETFAVTGWRPAPTTPADPTPSWWRAPPLTATSDPLGPPSSGSHPLSASGSAPRFNSDTSRPAAARTASPAVSGSTWTSTAKRGDRSARRHARPSRRRLKPTQRRRAADSSSLSLVVAFSPRGRAVSTGPRSALEPKLATLSAIDEECDRQTLRRGPIRFRLELHRQHLTQRVSTFSRASPWLAPKLIALGTLGIRAVT